MWSEMSCRPRLESWETQYLREGRERGNYEEHSKDRSEAVGNHVLRVQIHHSGWRNHHNSGAPEGRPSSAERD